MPDFTLNGCSPVPLAHYLKALGVLRLIAEQRDLNANARWRGDVFELSASLDAEGLVTFLKNDYRPTPVIAPWNGGSGFYPKDNSVAIRSITNSECPRLIDYREGIEAGRRELKRLKMKSKPDSLGKAILLQNCRNAFPDQALRWLDAVVVLGQDGAKYPPLLGTGGNDGRLEFTNNFMQRVTEVMEPTNGSATMNSEKWLRAALFAEPSPALATKSPIGQFFPGATGGANATSGFDGPGTVNPWDFILMIEGALLFAAASVKRLESSAEGTLIYPFCVRQAGVGYASASASDEKDARCEMWLPIWSEPTTLPELAAIFGEGRSQVRGRATRTGVDFAQAAVTLGVDRGITAFQRYGFQVRNGLAYFATPLDRVPVRRNARADLLADFETWHDRLRQKAGPQASPEPPASVARSLNRLERSMVELCRDGSTARQQTVLTALGDAERALARSLRWSKDVAYLRPLSGLRPGWLQDTDNGSAEFRLAASLAGMCAQLGKHRLHFRQHLEPISIGIKDSRTWTAWNEPPGKDVAWHEGDLVEVLNSILALRVTRVRQAGVKNGWPDRSPRPARLDDIAAFIEGRTDDRLLGDLIWGLSLIDWEQVDPLAANDPGEKRPTEAPRDDDTRNPPAAHRIAPSSFYALLRLCFRNARKGEDGIPVVPAILRSAMAGDGATASQLAARRLRASGAAPLIQTLPVSGKVTRRTAAAILFPISPSDFRLLEKTILNQQKGQET